MRERAINLKDWEVRALLAGADVIVRPIVPPPPCAPGDNDDLEILPALGEIKAPYAVGYVLWGRECWAAIWPEDHENGWIGERRIRDDECVIEYRADTDAKFPGNWPDDSDPVEAPRWRSSTHMPRWACRIERTVATVEPVRVRDIRASVIERMGFNVAAKLPLIPLPSCFDSVIDAVADKLFSEQWDADWPEYPYAGSPWAWLYEVTQ